MGVHDGHRERLKMRFLEMGLNCFDDHTALELLLFYAIPRRDTNATAHELINRFGSLSGVLSATPEELKSVDGIGDSAVCLIKLIPELERRCAIRDTENGIVFDSSEKAGTFLVPRYMGEKDEVVYVIFLDSANRLILCREMFRGVPNATEISARKIAETALAKKASGVIISHNHTSGIAIPSAADEESTKLIKQALGGIGITLIDHIIVADDDFISMSDSGLI